jgi:hypothetical protein
MKSAFWFETEQNLVYLFKLTATPSPIGKISDSRSG